MWVTFGNTPRRSSFACWAQALATEFPGEKPVGVLRVLRALDAEGRWVSTYGGERLVGQPKFERGFRYLDSGVFARNIELLAEYLK